MSSRDRSIIPLVVLIVIAVSGYFLIVKPEHHKASQIQTQITSQQSALRQAEAQVQAGQDAEAQYTLYAHQLSSITAAVPSDEQVPQLINELQTASTRNRVGFESVSTSGSSSSAAAVPASTSAATTGAATTGTASAGAATTATAFPSQSFSLSFTGSYFHVADLLGTLAGFVQADDKHFKASGRLLSISSVSLSPGTSSSDSSASASASNATGAGDVTASVTALDYDIPTASLSPATTPGG
jgi:uncharacterized phage infection (PIP) family protein YhgE